MRSWSITGERGEEENGGVRWLIDQSTELMPAGRISFSIPALLFAYGPAGRARFCWTDLHRNRRAHFRDVIPARCSSVSHL